MKDALGRRVKASLRVTVILLDGKRLVRLLRTPPGKYFSPEGVDKLLEQESARVEQFFPDAEFRLVPLLDGNFNFVEVKP